MSKGISICVFRNDLRIQDNPLLNAALKAKRDLLPVYIWDPRQYNLSSVNAKLGANFSPPKTWYFKFDRCLPPRMSFSFPNRKTYRRFRVESVLDLKKNLLSHGSDLLVRYGTPEEIVPALYKYLLEKGYRPVEVFIHREVSAVSYGFNYRKDMKSFERNDFSKTPFRQYE
jgi:deoxyribodipyrimidine photo-lyase